MEAGDNEQFGKWRQCESVDLEKNQSNGWLYQNKNVVKVTLYKGVEKILFLEERLEPFMHSRRTKIILFTQNKCSLIYYMVQSFSSLNQVH